MSDKASTDATLTLEAPDAASTTIYNGVSVGDMTATDAVLWTRATDAAGAGPVTLTAQVSTDPTFTAGVLTYTGSTSATADYTLKITATGLAANTLYSYRFVDASGGTSNVGAFTTSPTAAQKVGVRFAFSGDADGRFRPYDSVAGFGTAAQPQSQNLRFFVFLGDTMYETASTGSPAVPVVTSATSGTALTTALAAYDRKYLENVSGVTTATGAAAPTGQQSLQAMLAATGQYTLLDNHELGNASLQSGGAALAAGSRVTSAQGLDVNTTGAFDNQTAAYKTLEKAYFDYHPTKDNLDANLNSTGPTVNAPADARSNGTVQQYFAQQQGANAIYIQLDDRSYRDSRLGTATGADDVTSGRQLNPQRTMLGATQLAFFKQTLLAAQAAGTPWKFVSISSPIDQTGPSQDGKSWYGGYTAERNDILKFIADNNIQNVVFLSTDDHLTRETALTYQTTFGDAATTRIVPGAFLVVTGPIGAGGPDAVTDHSFANLTALAASTNAGLDAASAPRIGLSGFSGLSNVHRQGDAAATPSSIDFYSPDTFNYTTLDVSADGASLTVDTYGIPSYQQNTFPQTTPAPTDIMGFTLAANFTAAAPAPCYCPGTLILTEAGETPVERLAIGDRVVTHGGALRPIRWIGRRAYSGRFLEGQTHILPIRIARHAIAHDVPRRDLMVSPLHAMFIDGVLVPASALVNGATITQLQTVEHVAYVHIELETHDVILAEGAPSETFVDDDSRNMFHNVADFRARYPGATPIPARYCAPRIEDGEQLETIRRRLAARAGLAAPAPIASPLQGAVELVNRGLIAGWARENGAAPVILQVLANDVILAEVTADRPGPHGPHGFQLAIPGGLPPDIAHHIHVRRRSDGQTLANGRSTLAATPLPPPAAPCPVQGHLDGVTRDRIHGWAAGDTEAPVALQVLDNGRQIARILANTHRADLAQAGIGRGWHGFDLAIPGGLSPLARHVIQVRREHDGAELAGSPTVIEPAGAFDAAIQHAIAQAVDAAGTDEQDHVLAFLAAQSDRIRHSRAQSQARPAQRDAARRATRRHAPAVTARRALVIDERTPDASRDAGSQAILSHMQALQSLGYDVSFVAADDLAAPADALAHTGITLCAAPFYASVEEVLRRQAGCFDVIYLHRASTAARYLALARRHAPRARILYSVADLHHLRMQRQAALQSEPELHAASLRMRRTELAAAHDADAVLTHSLDEAALLHQALPGTHVVHAPWSLPVRKARPGFKARHGLAFIGNYAHAPNLDAALLLAEIVMPLVWQTAPDIECLLAGSSMPDRLHRLANPRLRLLGAVPDLHAGVLDRVRLTVAPLRFGAGVKGKVLESLAAGVPCVMTPVGAEGLALPPTLQALVSADAAALAATICRLHGHAPTHRAAAQAGLGYMREAHDQASVAAALKCAIEGPATPLAMAG